MGYFDVEGSDFFVDDEDPDPFRMELGLIAALDENGTFEAHIEVFVYQGEALLDILDLGTPDMVTEFIYGLMRYQNLANELTDRIQGETDFEVIDALVSEFTEAHPLDEDGMP